jgi:nucleobase:cation symporter-1, NCS1 family
MKFSWIVRKMNWRVPDLFKGKEDNIYWFHAGLNWRAFLAWTMVIWPSMPGFVAAVTVRDYGVGWTRVFQVTWVVGFCGGGLVYYIICLISPPPGGPHYEKVLLDSHESTPAETEGRSISDGEPKGTASADVADVEKRS